MLPAVLSLAAVGLSPDARHHTLLAPAFGRRTAICLVGEPRSISHTAPVLRERLLEHLDADAFVVSVTKEPVSNATREAFEALGSHVVHSEIGHPNDVLEQDLVARTAAAPLTATAWLVQQEPHLVPSWPQRFAEQFLTRKACRDRVRAHEEARGVRYDAYARIRLDTLLLEDFPSDFVDELLSRPSAAYPSDYADDSSLARPVDFDKVTDPDEALDRAITANGTTNVLNEYGDVVVIPHKRLGVAAVPTGQDYGPVGNLGLNDKFLIGDSRAFEADSHVYLTLTRNLTGHGSAPTWIMEQLNRDHNLAWGVNVSRFPLRYVTLRADGSAKYVSELYSARQLYGKKLLTDRPGLCGSIKARLLKHEMNCDAATGEAQLPDKTLMPESMRVEDPGFCNLMKACLSAAKSIGEETAFYEAKTNKLPAENKVPAWHPLCLPDGTVYDHGKWILGTAPCLFDDLHTRLHGRVASEGGCAAAKLLERTRHGEVTRDDVELVVSSHNEPLNWTEPWAPLRTVYLKGDAAVTESLSGPPPIPLANVGRESHTYLYHITANYETLAKRTVFMQDREPSCGFFRFSSHLGDHLNTNVSFADYMDPANGDTFMPLTIRFDANLTRSSLRSTFADMLETSAHRVSRPVPQAPSDDSTDFWLPFEANDFQSWIYEVSDKVTPPNGTNVTRVPFLDFYRNVFDSEPPPVVYFAQGGQFAASDVAIRRTPKHKYQYVLDMIEKGHEEFVYYCEAAWFTFMHGPDHPMIALDESSETVSRLEPRPLLSHMLMFETEVRSLVVQARSLASAQTHATANFRTRLKRRMQMALLATPGAASNNHWSRIQGTSAASAWALVHAGAMKALPEAGRLFFTSVDSTLNASFDRE